MDGSFLLQVFFFLDRNFLLFFFRSSWLISLSVVRIYIYIYIFIYGYIVSVYFLYTFDTSTISLLPFPYSTLSGDAYTHIYTCIMYIYTNHISHPIHIPSTSTPTSISAFIRIQRIPHLTQKMGEEKSKGIYGTYIYIYTSHTTLARRKTSNTTRKRCNLLPRCKATRGHG